MPAWPIGPGGVGMDSAEPGTASDGAPEAASAMTMAEMTMAEMAARVAAIRTLIEAEPARLGSLLQTGDAGFRPEVLLSPHAPTTLALLDELGDPGGPPGRRPGRRGGRAAPASAQVPG